MEKIHENQYLMMAVLPKENDRVSISGMAKYASLFARFGGWTNDALKLEKIVVIK